LDLVSGRFLNYTNDMSLNSEDLDQRKRAILKAVCTEHIARAEPVGSEHLAAHYALGVRSATLRNEMAEMTELGYLRQPHTSAGRVPSDRGYRYYVDRLMSLQPIMPQERRSIRRLQERLNEQVNEILREACRLVSDLTRYTTVATPPIVPGSRLQAVRLLVLDPRRAIVVLALESGRVEHQVVETNEGDLAERDVPHLQAILNELFAGRACRDLAAPPDFSAHGLHRQRLLDRIAAAIQEGLRPPKGDELVVQGEANALREPEFHDLKRLDSLLELLHSRQAVYDLISHMDRGGAVAIIIGSEIGYEKARECSFVAAQYFIGGNSAGAIGVFGPTRMRYSQVVSVVETVAAQVSDVLTAVAGGA
jgi:heat-inducible transcriptional repressor